jgi:nicotinate-nucleotide adenylyltransferase
MRLAIFGGSFDPPHVAHLLAAVYVLETHAFGKAPAPYEDRLEMCRRAFATLGDRVVVSDLEREIAGPDGHPSYTIETVQALAAKRPGSAFRLIIGADILAETHKWHRFAELEQLAPPLVIGRQGFAWPADREKLVELPAVSSTEVRARLTMGESAAALVPARVLEYVSERGLYRR